MENNDEEKPSRKKVAAGDLIKHFNEYEKYLKSNPFKVPDFVGKDGREVDRKKEKPLTMVGFENYCFFKGYIADLKDYFSNKDGRYDEYKPECRIILNLILQDHTEGAMAGMYHHGVTARLNGWSEKTDNLNTNINRNFEITMDLGDKNPNEDKV